MGARKAKRRTSPRRKAGSKPSRKANKKIVFRLVVEAQEMLVRYTPNYFGGEFSQGHFEFRSPHRPPRRIAISETGYHSHFAPMQEIGAARNAPRYARSFVLSMLDGSTRTRNATDERQMRLF